MTSTRPWLLALVAASACAQTSPLTINQAVAQALEKYPATRVSIEQVAAAAAGINLARTSYLPRADFVGQLNRATRNNVFGMLLPQQVIPPISGPVLGTNNFTNVWGSALGVLVSWEPFDFGLRKANIETAEITRRRAEAGVDETRLEVAASAADAYLTVLAAEQTVIAARAGVSRADIFRDIVGALVKNQLRPGADESRARAESALAQNQVIQAEQATVVARTVLVQLLGPEAASAPLQSSALLMPRAQLPPENSSLADHPAAREQRTAIEESQSREHALEKSYYPRFNLQAAAYGRGTGAHPDGTTGGAVSGLGPNTQNWALGLTVSFPAFDLPSIRERRNIEKHRALGEQARYDQLVRDLNARVERARAQLEGAGRVAANTPVVVEAARDSERQATARYRAGLATLIEVADAQRLLTQAEIDDALARLAIWRARLNLAIAGGSVDPFLREVSSQ